MINEIGSEFWSNIQVNTEVAAPVWSTWPGSQRSFLSGRTALSAILDDILKTRPCRSAYLPAYCCHTMIEPFIAHGIEVAFYPVFSENGQMMQKIDANKTCDIVLCMDYFGFVGQTQKLPENAILIRDLTHSLFSIPGEADYLFASFRKWGAVAGAAIACKNGEWCTEAPIRINESFISLRRRGYAYKSRYMAGEMEDKQGFLGLFAEAEELLDRDYCEYAADEGSLNAAAYLQSCVQTRRENARYLLDGLKSIDSVEPIFSSVGETDAPLFVPILTKNREKLKKYLIQNEIYCPVHWPRTGLHDVDGKTKKLYEEELSLICDQRYGETDMKRIIDTIRRGMIQC